MHKTWQQLLIGIGMLSIFLLYAYASPASRVFIFILFSIILFIIATRYLKDPVLSKILIIALLLYLTLAIVQAYTFINLPGAGLDTLSYEGNGWDYAQAWLSGDKSLISNIDAAFVYYSALIGGAYFFFGRIVLVAQFINVLCGTMLIYFTYQTTYLISSSIRASRLAACITMLYPTIAIFSAILLREIYVIIFLLLSFYLLLKWLREGRIYLIVFSVMAVIGASLLHGALVVICLIHLFFIVFFKPVEMKLRVSLRNILLALLIIAGIFLLLQDIIIYQIPDNIFELFTLDFLRSSLECRKFGRTLYLEGLVPESYFDLMWQTPVRILFLLFAPFPWMIVTVGDAFVFVDILIYIFLFYYGFRWLKKIYLSGKIEMVALMLFVLSIATIYAWGTTNYGTAWRHRAKLAPFVIIMGSAAINYSGKYKFIFPED